MGKPARYGMDIYAVTYRSNIKSESIPELRLNSILSKTSNLPTKANLSLFLREFEFRNIEILTQLMEGYEEQMISESTIDDTSPMDRIRFIFKDSELVAIVHTRRISDLLDPHSLTRGRYITILKQMNRTALHEFLEINKKAYSEMD